MSEFGKRLLKRSIMVALALGLMGYILAIVFLEVHRMNGGIADPANEAVRWKTPLTMAGFGVGLQFLLEAVAYSLRRKKTAGNSPATAVSAPSSSQRGSPID